MRFTLKYFLLAALVFTPHAAMAENCTLVVDYNTSAIIHEDGDCKTRHAPESTFKLPLALIGFDSGILKDAHTPEWDYKPEYKANREEEKHPTDPTRWEKDSVVWFSQQITQKLGKEKFQNYVDALGYGNKDLSGDPGKDNGLTHAWLSSSLQISPVEQVAFVRKLLKRDYALSAHAYDMVMEIVPHFTAGDWAVRGKTGSGFERNADGTLNRDRQRGWFVGWAEKDGRKIVYAKFMADGVKTKGYAGPRTRESFLKDLPAIMAQDRHNDH